MKSSVFHQMLFLACTILTAACTSAQTASPAERAVSFGIKGGLIFGGTVDFEGKGAETYTGDFDTEDSYSLGVFFDIPFYKAIHAQVNVDIHDFALESDMENDDHDYSENLLLGSVGLRYVMYSRDQRLSVRPGASIGYGYMADVEITDATTHVIMVLSNEFVFFPKQKTGILAELGLLWDLAGGNDDWDVTAGPLLLIRGGLLF